MKWLGAALTAAVIVLIAWPELTRPGYTADEEFTEFAIRGIAASSLPLLPSGLLYDRGLAYSYAAALPRLQGHDGLAWPRALSLATALAALAALWLGVRRISNGASAWLAVLLVATSIPFWVVATTARFYAPFIACYLATVALLASLGRVGAPRVFSIRTAGLLFVLAASCRWTHELAFTLAAIPVCGVAFERARRRITWVYVTIAVTAGLVAAQAGILAVHFLAPKSGATMIRRFFLWQVVNLFERPPAAAPIGLLLVLGLLALVIRPRLVRTRWSTISVRWTASVVLVLLVWGIATRFAGAFAYPLDLFRHLVRTMPLATLATLALLGARAIGLGGPWRPAQRAAHLLWLGWVLCFGVIDSGVTINYLLAPVTLMLAALALDLIAVARTAWPNRHARRIATATVAVVVGAIELNTWGLAPHTRLLAARPTIVAPDDGRLREAMARAAVVACTDELACLFLVGRVDRWLALDPFLRERFIVSRPDGDVGVYAGRPALTRLGDAFATADGPATHVLVVDVFKELPVGPSSAFLPRAMAAEGITGVTRVATTQLHVVELDSASASPRPRP